MSARRDAQPSSLKIRFALPRYTVSLSTDVGVRLTEAIDIAETADREAHRFPIEYDNSGGYDDVATFASHLLLEWSRPWCPLRSRHRVRRRTRSTGEQYAASKIPARSSRFMTE